jgi:peptidoglycan/xylan/chitin deacetylase (PgdA/CDA1 family)
MGTVFLSIDDAPSAHFQNKIDYLAGNNIPAIFFCAGKTLEKSEPQFLHALQRGFMVENHSYSHVRFSTISLNQAQEEIRITDGLLDRLYLKAGVDRRFKLFRFPFLDRGGENARDIQNYLKLRGYRHPDFGFLRQKLSPDNTAVDIGCTINFQEYKQTDRQSLLNNINRLFPENKASLRNTNDVLLMHDFSQTKEVFYNIIDELIRRRISFGNIAMKTVNHEPASCKTPF